jgi:hypothetical protein
MFWVKCIGKQRFGAYSLCSEFLVVPDKVFVLQVVKTGLSE